MLRAEGLGFIYPTAGRVFSGVGFELRRGEVLGLLGPNGTGKTTLLKCLNRILVPSEGRVTLDGVDVAAMSPRERAERIGYVPQYAAPAFRITVVDAVLLGRIPFAGRRLSRRDKDIAFGVIERMKLEPFAFRPLDAMSGGERQRVAIARALAQEPGLLILDEPTSSLDMKNQLFILGLIRELAQERSLAVILSIHDLNLAAMFADKLMMLKDARLHAFGESADVLTREAIREVYDVETVVTTEDGYRHVRLLRR